MAGNRLKYDGPLTENDLPIDAHELIALSAPRPVFLGAAAAGPVYKLLDKKDLGVTDFPQLKLPSSTATSPSANTPAATPPPPTGPPS